MEELKNTSSNSWSTLTTVRSIDAERRKAMHSNDNYRQNELNDFGITGKDIIPASREMVKSSAKSLIIESLVDQLCKLLEKDPQRRKKIYEGICTKLCEMKLVDETYKLEELSSLRGYYQQAMINLLRPPEPSLYKMPYNFEWSRYSSEYEEIGFIAAGGFGKVYKAKHHLDQVFYAVKKINVKFKNLSILIMESNEVKTLAKLNHPNIVQYKAAWLEPIITVTPALPIPDAPQYISSDSDEIVFAEELSSSVSDDMSSSNKNENDNSLALCKYNKGDLSHSQGRAQISATLYVSMQLCDETLRQWLNKRNQSGEPLNLSLCINIMIQAAKGLEYIHSCNIVHHDIKPSNIFLSNNLKCVQVGDFGLSCCLQGHTHSACPLEGGRFGTPLYASPEQHKRQCNLKGDMYSLGLVFIELVSIFSTEMERVYVLKKSRSGQIPDTIPSELVPVIKKLISSKVDERPSSTELLKMLYKIAAKPVEAKWSLSITKTHLISLNDKSQTDSASQTGEQKADYSNGEFDEIIRIKDREIVQLKLMLAKRDDEIAQLKQNLNRNSS